MPNFPAEKGERLQNSKLLKASLKHALQLIIPAKLSSDLSKAE